LSDTQGTTVESPGGASFSYLAAPLLSALLFLSIFFLPGIGWLLNFFAPLPMIYYFFTHGRRAAHIALLTASAGIGAAFGMEMGLYYLSCYGLLALVMGEMINRNSTMEAAVASAAFAAILFSILLLFFTSQVPLGDFYQKINEQAAAIISQSIEAYKQAGINAEQIAVIEENIPWIAKWIVFLMPGAIITAFITLSVGNYIGYKFLKTRLPYLPPADPRPVLFWAVPDKTVFAAIIGGGMSLLSATAIRALGLNILFVTGTLYTLSGFCILQHFFIRSRLPFFVRWTGYILLLLQPFLILIVMFLGLFDLWFDFRKIRGQKTDKKEE
ncbi:MAG: DUF2232 domain-containing protein, partial [Nitrospinota bacterium]